MNNDFIIFWSTERVVYFDIQNKFELANFEKLNFEVPPSHHSVIKHVFANKDPNVILIKLELSDGTSAIIGWDLNIDNIIRELYGL